MASLTDPTSILIGLLLAVIAGFLNGSWNVSFRPSHGFAVGRNTTTALSTTTSTRTTIDLEYHQAWILFQVYAVVINIPVCLFWAGGPQNVAEIVSEAKGSDILLIVIFSLFWGVGSVGFGLACKVAGVGLGTNLCMGVIMVLGTFLPLCLEGAIATAAGGLVVAGLVVCCIGLAFGVQSLQVRDGNSNNKKGADSLPPPEKTLPLNETPTASVQLEMQAVEAVADTTTATSPSSPMPVVLPVPSMPEHSPAYKVAVCVIAGVFATQLQFAFVFGQDMIDFAENLDGVPSSGRNAVIWLFAITLGAPASIVYGAYGKPAHIPWSHVYQCPWYRHAGILCTTSIPWVSHIHLYGFANTLLPDDLAASVAWPILMMGTVVTGMLWSVLLEEWTDASILAKQKLYQSVAAVSMGVALIMVSVSL